MAQKLIGNAFTIEFDGGRPAQPLARPVSGAELMNALLQKGYIAFKLKWEPCLEAQLAIEDDVIFICDALAELRDSQAGATEQFVHLGDGELEIRSTFEANDVRIDLQHMPQLDPRRRTQYELTMPLQEYVRAWTNLVADLQHEAG